MQQFISQYKNPHSSQAVRELARIGMANALHARPDLLKRIWYSLVPDFNEWELPEGYMAPQDLIEPLIAEVLTKKFFTYRTDGELVGCAITVLRRVIQKKVIADRRSRGQSSLRGVDAAAAITTREKLENEVFKKAFGGHLVAALQSNSQMTPVERLVFCYVERGKRPAKRNRNPIVPASPKNSEVLMGLLGEDELRQICSCATGCPNAAASVVNLMYPTKTGSETDLATALGLTPKRINTIKTDVNLKQAFQASVNAAQAAAKREAVDYAANAIVG